MSYYPKDFLLEVSAGRIPSKKLINIYGEHFSEAGNTLTYLVDLWPLSSTSFPYYNYDISPEEMFISNSEIADNQKVLIKGLGEDYREKEIEVTISGQSKINIGRWWRVYSASNMDAVPLTGDVYIYTDTTPIAGIPALSFVRCFIKKPYNTNLTFDLATHEKSTLSMYTIPRGKKGTLLSVKCGSSRISASNSTLFNLSSRKFGGTFIVIDTFSIPGNLPEEYKGGIIFEEKSDIKVAVRTLYSDAITSILYTILLEDTE